MLIENDLFIVKKTDNHFLNMMQYKYVKFIQIHYLTSFTRIHYVT